MRRVVDVLIIGIFAFALISLGWKLTANNESPTEEELAEQNKELLGKRIAWDQSITLRWGKTPFALTRERLRGTEDDVVDRLGKQIAGQIEHADVTAKISDAEKSFLKRLTDQTPLATVKGKWRVDAVPGPVVLVAGTHLDDSQPRIACWGFGLPDRDGWWTLMIFRHTKDEAPLASGWPRFDGPAGTSVFLELRTPHGGGLMGMSIPGSSEAAAVIVNRLVESEGWGLAGQWRKTVGGISARFTKSSGPGDIEVSLRSETERKQSVLFRFLPKQ